MTILGAATLTHGLMRLVDLAEQPKKGAKKKNRPGAGTPNRLSSWKSL